MQSLVALDLPLGPTLLDALGDCVGVGQAFCVLDQRLSARRRDEALSWLGATEVRDADGTRTLSDGRQVDDDVGLVMLTSGSSGTPKAAELTWKSLRASAELTQNYLRGAAVPVWYPVLPANHIGGLAVLLRSLFSDATVLWGDPNELSSAPSRGATHVALVRAQLARHDVKNFEFVLVGGARPPGDVPGNVVATWGMTETGSGIVYDGVALPGVEVAAVNGELCVRTPTLFRSYRDSVRPQVRGPDGRDDWFPTGDAGEVNADRVSVKGRLGFVINTGAEKLWPEELEAVFALVAGVIDVAITGVDDEEWGQRVVAFVVADSTNLDERLLAVAEEYVGPWAKPKEIHYVTAIPRTDNGKIRRSALSNLS